MHLINVAQFPANFARNEKRKAFCGRADGASDSNPGPRFWILKAYGPNRVISTPGVNPCGQ